MHNQNKITAQKIVATTPQIIELGFASCLTQGAEKGWFEYGRPGHPKNRVAQYILNTKKTYEKK